MRRRKAASDDEESDNELPRRRTRDSGSESDSSQSDHSDEEEVLKSNSPRGTTETVTLETNAANQDTATRGNTGQEERVPSGRGYRNFHNKREEENAVNEIQNLSIDDKRGGRYNRRSGRQYSRNRDNNSDNQNKPSSSPSYRNKNPSVQFRPKQPKQEGSTTATTANDSTNVIAPSQDQQQQQNTRTANYQKKYTKQSSGPKHRERNNNEEQTHSNANITSATSSAPTNKSYNNNNRTQQGGYKSKSYTGRRNAGSEMASSSSVNPSDVSSNISPITNLVPFNSVENTNNTDTTNATPTTIPYTNSPYMAAPYPYHPASYGYPYNPYYIATIPTFASHDQGIQYYPLPPGYNPYTKQAVPITTPSQDPTPLSSSSPAFVPGKIAARQRNPIPIVDPNDVESKKQTEVKENVNSISNQQDSKVQ